jgi:hypothetical protein
MPENLVLLAEEYRASLPPGFDAVAQEVTVLLETGSPIDTVDRGDSVNQRIRQAVLRELRDFLCTDHKKYEEVRAHGRVITRMSITSVAAYVAGAVGITAGAAMACVAFVALAVGNIGTGVFCRLAKGDKSSR